MTRLTHREHTPTTRELLMSVTSCVPLRVVRDNTSRVIQSERHEWQDSVAAWANGETPSERRHVGCSSACADGDRCDCSHSTAWNAPRQPRRPSRPAHPRLSLWRRIGLAWSGSPGYYLTQTIGVIGLVLAACLLIARAFGWGR